MPILGARASATKPAPGAPTVGTATVTNSTTVSLTFTAPTSKLPPTSYTVTSSPSIALSVSGSSSPLTVTGSFVISTGYTFSISAVNAQGTSPASSSSNSITPKTTYSLGDAGPGGGRIFYDAGSTLSWGRYLEAATSASSPAWNDSISYLWKAASGTLGCNATAIGTGKANTDTLVANNGPAGTVCRNYTGGGFSGSSTGWFLPSKDELNQIYIRQNIIGGFISGTAYWSSSEHNASLSATHAWAQFINDSGQNGATYLVNKTNTQYPVRAIRSF
jgi:hypothetical protein